MDELAAVELGVATEAEAPILARMSRDYIEHGLVWRWRTPTLRNMIREKDAIVLCARVHKPDRVRIAGFAVMQFSLETAHLNLLAVDPSMRRRGVARQLMAWLDSTAAVAGTTAISLEVRARNTGARAFYKRLGYEEVEYVPRYYSGVESAFRMRRKLR